MTDIYWLQLTIPSPSAILMARACQKAMNDAENDSEYNIYEQLRDYFEHAAANPRGFVPTGRMATSLKLRARRVDGVRRNDGSLKDGTPRAKRTARRKAAHKKRRATRATDAKAFNAARDAIERELRDVEGDGQQPVPRWKRILTRGGASRPEGQDPGTDLPRK